MKPCATYSAGYNRSMKAIALLLLLTGCSTIHKLNAALDSIPPLVNTLREDSIQVKDSIVNRVDISSQHSEERQGWVREIYEAAKVVCPVAAVGALAWYLGKLQTRRQNEKDHKHRSRVLRTTGSLVR